MPTLCRAYTTDDEVQGAVERLLATGLAGAEIRVLMGEATHDGRDEPVGGFGGGEQAAAKSVGSFGDSPGSSRDAMGGFAGAAEDARRGGFGDLDRDTVTTYPSGVAHVRVASHRNLTKALVETGLDEPTAAADVKALHAGRILVLVRTDSSATEAATAALDG